MDTITQTANSDRQHALLKRAQRIVSDRATPEDRYIPDHQELQDVLEILRHMGCAIAFTMGTWDMFHIGHIQYIHQGKEAAKRLCPDAEMVIMVVGVDTDALTKERKGPQRPVVSEEERCGVLQYQRPISIVTKQYVFDQLYTVVRPDVLILSVTTGDLVPDKDVITSNCGKIVTLPPQAPTSTTARIRELHVGGASEVAAVLNKALTEYFQGKTT
jgi:D-beta-D-heptose 7-phosphate kinase/D-beta-D-heptose 1-phosphate adenosyltransferase